MSGANSILQPLRGDATGYVDFLARSSFDIILMNAWQTWSSDLVLMNLQKIRGKKYLYSNCVSTNLILKKQPVRSLLRYLGWRPYWWDMPRLMRLLDGVIFVAEEGGDSRFDDLRLARKLGIRHSVIPNAFSGFCTTLTTAASDSGARHQLVAVGSYDWFKGHDFVLRAYARSSARNRLPLKIFGPVFTKFTDELRRLASKLGLDERFVTIHEKVEKVELLRECRRSRLLISGSHTECQPLVLLDAMALGTPFIARSCGCTPYLEGGVSVASDKLAAEAIDSLLNDNRRWEELSGCGKRAAAEKFDPEVVGQKLCAFLASSFD